MEFRAGERWCYRTPAGFEQSRMVIGAVVSFASSEPIVCCAVLGAPRMLPDGSIGEPAAEVEATEITDDAEVEATEITDDAEAKDDAEETPATV